MIQATPEQLAEVRYDDRGLVPAIAQDLDGTVLMLAWMNAESLAMTLAEGRMVYWSRSRGELWRKGDTSGDRQIVHEAWYDCDADVLLFKVEQVGSGACHTGRYSCFFRRFGTPPDVAAGRASASYPPPAQHGDGLTGAAPGWTET